ncbi:MAG TPA: hypothetical protein VFF67_10385 [Thermoplasmata archaeon]|nr:hypothetical protein [Thermoplasmata archaeon]
MTPTKRKRIAVWTDAETAARLDAYKLVGAEPRGDVLRRLLNELERRKFLPILPPVPPAEVVA